MSRNHFAPGSYWRQQYPATGERVLTPKTGTSTLRTAGVLAPISTVIGHKPTLWIPSLGYQRPTMQQASRSIELEEHHGSSTNGGETNNEGILEDKMLIPGVLAWVEQGTRALLRGVKVVRSEPLPTMFQRNDMINLRAIERHVLEEQAVCAPLSRSLKHEVPQRRKDCGKRHGREARAYAFALSRIMRCSSCS